MRPKKQRIVMGILAVVMVNGDCSDPAHGEHLLDAVRWPA